MGKLAVDVAAYLEDKKDRLCDLYKWKFDAGIPEALFGIKIANKSRAEETKSLRRQLSRFLGKKPDEKSKHRVAQYFIQDWGRIRNFTNFKYVVAQFEGLAGTTDIPKSLPSFERVSSWSKWASLVCPAWACIYDARVAYSLNGINYLMGGTHKIFPSPVGRNTRLRSLDAATLVLVHRLSHEAANVNPRFHTDDHVVPRIDAYREYLGLVRAVSEALWADIEHIQTVEMLLFAIADGDLYNDLVGHFRTCSNRKVRRKDKRKTLKDGSLNRG